MINSIDVKNQSVFDYIEKIKATDGVVLGYRVIKQVRYYSKRYDKWIVCEVSDISDGATDAPDLDSFGWLIHDDLCNKGIFEDGTKCTNLQASTILKDIFKAEDKWFRQYTWFVATWLFGGGKARKNGMF